MPGQALLFEAVLPLTTCSAPEHLRGPSWTGCSASLVLGSLAFGCYLQQDISLEFFQVGSGVLRTSSVPCLDQHLARGPRRCLLLGRPSKLFSIHGSLSCFTTHIPSSHLPAQVPSMWTSGSTSKSKLWTTFPLSSGFQHPFPILCSCLLRTQVWPWPPQPPSSGVQPSFVPDQLLLHPWACSKDSSSTPVSSKESNLEPPRLPSMSSSPSQPPCSRPSKSRSLSQLPRRHLLPSHPGRLPREDAAPQELPLAGWGMAGQAALTGAGQQRGGPADVILVVGVTLD